MEAPHEQEKVVRSQEAAVNDTEVGANDLARWHPAKWQSNVTIVSCYIANFSDGLQNSLANPTNVIFKKLLGTGYSSDMKTRMSNSVIVGAILGVVVFGFTSDLFSRRGGLLVTSSLVTIGTLMSTLALQVHPSHNMLWFMVITRGIAGFGVGGEYPPSAAAGLEESDEVTKRYRGPLFVSFTTLMATLAGPILQIIYFICLVASGNNVTVAYHAIYSIATLVPLFIVVLRLLMVDSALFHQSNLKKQRRSPRLYLDLVRRYWWRIFTTSLAFFLYDFINFPNSIMSSTIISSLVKDGDIRQTATWQVILAVLPVPGVMIGAWLTNAIGRRNTGIAGFAGYVVLGFIIGGTYSKLSKHIAAFVVLYGLLQAFGHMGPGATIGLISSESFPTAIRGMGYGIATAFGRTGAAVGTQCFTPLEDAAGTSSTFYLAGGVAVLGIIVYCFLPESSKMNLAKEDRELEAYLAQHGYELENNS
ncbi:hypothetical protein N7468_000042 [Penicillium chermesinum]|uniref:Major facilitator superfamily (MFS) profile domain-containing protein n=1 Tax=Penicillium chermesinum TaxID=63820 RepID=A0A9W9PJL1_9EURO|nr:uncharacterized protein N7468_000042 [Penicillium chermesinum]KAJ5248591.1 hypothetical protein N7468_000042 [Penicillium chermesinum]KAJ6150706.1 hypothetical protein N7470_007300 [Penicillium chermesinum]